MITELGDEPDLEACAEQSACSVLRATAETQVERAQQAGVIRADVDADDIVRLVDTIALTTEKARGDAAAERLFTLMVDGLRASRPRDEPPRFRRRWG